MQWIWYLPSLIIGLSFGVSSGYWQLAAVSVLMVAIIIGSQVYKNRYPQFDQDSPIHISKSSVAIGNRVLPRWQLLWKPQWHQLLVAHLNKQSAGDYFTSVLQKVRHSRFQANRKDSLSLSCWIGATSSSELILDLVSDGPHLIVVGPTGSGKSELLRLMLTSMLETQKFSLVLFDYKGGAALEAFSQHAIGMATDLDQAKQRELLELVAKELASRERLFSEAKCSSIEQYVATGQEMPRLVVVVDEFVAALSSSPQALVTLEDITARGRSLGVHLIAATQSLSGVSRSMLTNLRARIISSSADPIDMVQLGINPGKHAFIEAAGWSSAIISRNGYSAESFNFPLGVRQEPLLAQSTASSEPPQPARSLALRQMYSSQEPELDRPAVPASNPDSQLLLRMAGLHSSAHR